MMAGEEQQPLTRREVAKRLRLVIDPELGMNIIDLGLVYDIQVEGAEVKIAMTMTTPACPMQQYIHQSADHVLRRIPQVEEVTLKTVWQPTWSPHMVNRKKMST